MGIFGNISALEYMVGRRLPIVQPQAKEISCRRTVKVSVKSTPEFDEVHIETTSESETEYSTSSDEEEQVKEEKKKKVHFDEGLKEKTTSKGKDGDKPKSAMKKGTEKASKVESSDDESGCDCEEVNSKKPKGGDQERTKQKLKGSQEKIQTKENNSQNINKNQRQEKTHQNSQQSGQRPAQQELNLNRNQNQRQNQNQDCANPNRQSQQKPQPGKVNSTLINQPQRRIKNQDYYANISRPIQSQSNNIGHQPQYTQRKMPIRVLQGTRADVVLREDVIEIPSDPRPNSFFDGKTGVLRVYHGPVYGNPYATLVPITSQTMPLGAPPAHAGQFGNPPSCRAYGGPPPTPWGNEPQLSQQPPAWGQSNWNSGPPQSYPGPLNHGNNQPQNWGNAPQPAATQGSQNPWQNNAKPARSQATNQGAQGSQGGNAKPASVNGWTEITPQEAEKLDTNGAMPGSWANEPPAKTAVNDIQPSWDNNQSSNQNNASGGNPQSSSWDNNPSGENPQSSSWDNNQSSNQTNSGENPQSSSWDNNQSSSWDNNQSANQNNSHGDNNQSSSWDNNQSSSWDNNQSSNQNNSSGDNNQSTSWDNNQSSNQNNLSWGNNQSSGNDPGANNGSNGDDGKWGKPTNSLWGNISATDHTYKPSSGRKENNPNGGWGASTQGNNGWGGGNGKSSGW